MKPDAYVLTIELESSEDLGTVIAVLAGKVRHYEISARYAGVGTPVTSVPQRTGDNFTRNWPGMLKKSQIAKVFDRSVAVGETTDTGLFGKILEDSGLRATSASPFFSRLRVLEVVERVGSCSYRRLK